MSKNPYKEGSIRAKAWERGVKETQEELGASWGMIDTPNVLTWLPVATANPNQKDYTIAPLTVNFERRVGGQEVG